MSEKVGCPECGEVRCDPVEFNENDDLILRCRGCGHTMIAITHQYVFEVDRNGNVLSKSTFSDMKKQVNG